MIRTGLFRYVRHEQVYTFNARGWMVTACLGETHGRWSVLMWGCDCPCFQRLNGCGND